MNIIFEGIDNSGKSTLAKAVHDGVFEHWPMAEKEGRPATFQGVIEKIERYLQFDDMIIDRHPCISQVMYGWLRDDPPVPDALLEEFYRQKPLIIYCRAIEKRLDGHKQSPSDDDDHLQLLRDNYELLLHRYDKWAVKNAHIIYTRYDQTQRVIAMVKGVERER